MRLLALLGLALATAAPAVVRAQPPAGPPEAPPAAESAPDEESPPAAAPADESGPVGGEIRAEQGRAEILPEPPPVGRTVNTPEGWYRVEAAPSRDDEATGSFSVVAPALLAPPAPAPARAAGAAAPAPAAEAEEAAVEVTVESAAAEDPCRAEKDRYLARLLEFQEIRDVDAPLALLEGLEELPASGFTPFVRLSLFGLPAAGPGAVDPIRPLAWDLELRSIARDLAACVEASR